MRAAFARAVQTTAYMRPAVRSAAHETKSIAQRINDARVTVVLGSGSPTRRAVLTSLGVAHVVEAPNIDEKSIRHDDPHALVTALAQAKATKVLEVLAARDNDSAEGEQPRVLVITCDQVVVHRGEIREKPTSVDEAKSFIRGYGVEPPSTVGSVMVTDVQSGRSSLAVDVNTIVFDGPFPDDVVDGLVADGTCMKCAGGLMVEHELLQPYLNRIDGRMDGVMGLSAVTVERLLAEYV